MWFSTGIIYSWMVLYWLLTRPMFKVGKLRFRTSKWDARKETEGSEAKVLFRAEDGEGRMELANEEQGKHWVRVL